MENRNTRNLTNLRNGLNLAVSTNFDVALSVDAMVPRPQAKRHAHPHALLKRGQGEKAKRQSIAHGRDWPISGLWPTEHAVVFALSRMPVSMRRSAQSLPESQATACTYHDVHDARRDSFGRDRRRASLGRSIARREPFWTLS